MFTSSFPLDQVINRSPLTVSPDVLVTQVLKLMSRNQASYVLVVAQQLVGILTARDVVRMAAENRNLAGLSIAAVMTSPLISLKESETQDILTVLSLLSQHHIRHLPVVNNQNQLTGIISHETIRNTLKPADLLKLRRVAEVMATQLICAPSTTSVLQLTQLMQIHQLSCVVISQTEPEETIRPIGIVTESDVVKLQAQGRSLGQISAAVVMSQPLLPIRAEDPLWEAYELMQRHQVRRLVVVGQHGELVGLVTQTSLLQVLDPTEAYIAIETLQRIVDERTTSLRTTNEQLERRIVERKRAKAALQKQMARERLVAGIAQRIRCSLNLEEILKTTVVEVRQFLQADRALIYQFDSDLKGTVVVESVAAVWMSIQEKALAEFHFALSAIQFYQKGRIHSLPDIFSSGLSEHQVKELTELGIRAHLVVPIVERQNLWGLLIVNQCSEPRWWEKLEVHLLKQLATQVSIAIQQAQLYRQLEAANQQLQYLAASDGLTQVANRRRFDECLELEWLRLTREQLPLALILCDVDYFKRYNDTYGHQAGDECLRQVAQAMSHCSKRPADLVARYGGEEFAVILPNTSAAGARCVAEEIQVKVKALKIIHAASQVNQYLTLSMGVACTIPSQDLSSAFLIAAADQALYEAKKQGRDRIILAQQ
jgi:diguanylate cyclase (GGDEF)-like protein